MLLVKMILEILTYPSIPAQKAVMKMIGLNLGPTRLPLRQLTEEEHLQLFGKVEEIGFFKALKPKKSGRSFDFTRDSYIRNGIE